MKAEGLTDYGFRLHSSDLARMFNVFERANPDLSSDYIYNLNVGVSIDGILNTSDSYRKTYYTRAGDNLFVISNRLYGTVDYWWILAKLNGIDDALKGFEVGKTMYYISKGDMDNLVSTIVGES